MSLRINNLTLEIDEDLNLLKNKVCEKLNISSHYIKDFKILRESIDARRNSIKFNYSVEVSCEDEKRLIKNIKDKNIIFQDHEYEEKIVFGTKDMKERPVIVGMGPAGMFAGLMLAKHGYRPIIIERGEAIEERSKTVEKFWNTGVLNIESNVQFGEGGAGTFSDGKLTTRIKDKRCSFILEEMVKAGAPKEIIYSGKPHIGTDILKNVVKNIRNNINSLGGEIRFNSKLENIIIKDGKVNAIIVNKEEIPCENLILAIGHSSRDTYEMLYKNNIFMESKAFAIGVRVEHLKEMIDKNQYGKYAGHPRLKAADYRLTYTTKNSNRAVYSFCMCPGGEVVAAASEEGLLVTNGMSYYSRNKDNSNSAIVVSVTPEDFEGNTPLKGMEFQRYYERLAYKLGGENYNAPVQLIEDFLKDKNSSKLGAVKPSYKPGYEFKNISECLPNYVIDSLKEGFSSFDNRIKGFASNDAILTGIETRTSAPVRLTRNENLESISLKGLYPAGEGAGYAGGIISAAVDGVKVAENIIKTYSSLK
ncbi:NAD(P)/FAD-dependent oxidoreductase [Clostridium botulinum]|uniref:NAD(P)/FAD-dependent oxidoreductase n=1 Tax=Clostridium botulinum TaxID=1491 RepID=UPI003A7F77D8